MTKQRNQYFDYLRGIAITMVIAIHTSPALKEYDSLESISVITFRQILNCAVPLFLAISGYFIAKKDFSTRENRKMFWRKQIPTVYIPCLLFSIGWFILDAIAHGLTNPFDSILMLITCGYSIYYFIAVIIQLYIATPWLLRLTNWGGVILTAVVSGISIFIVTYMLQIEGKSFPLIMYAGPFVLWILFFMMGIWYSTQSRNYSLILPILIVLVGLVASVIESKYYLSMHGSGMGIKFSSFVFSAGMIMLLFSEKVEKLYSNNALTRVILYIGEISFGIYLIHMYVRIAVGFAHINSWFIEWALTLGITVGIIVITKRLLPGAFTRKYLGFR